MSEKAVFLDRDDTIIKDSGYINDPEDVNLLPGAARGLLQLRSMGYKLVLVSNQSGVARGIVTEKALGDIHERLEELLAKEGAYLDGIYYCPYHPEGSVAKYRRESELRKPNPGMLLRAAEQFDIELGASWAIGDSQRDIEAGLRAGCRTILIEQSEDKRQLQIPEAKPHFRAVNIAEAVNIIKKHSRNMQKERSGEEKASHQSPAEQSENPGVSESVESSSAPLPSGEDDDAGTSGLLKAILQELRRSRRAEMFGDFSIMRFMAGIVQVVVLFCLLIALWLVMSPRPRGDAILITLLFAAVLQVMALTFFMVEGPRR